MHGARKRALAGIVACARQHVDVHSCSVYMLMMYSVLCTSAGRTAVRSLSVSFDGALPLCTLSITLH